MNIEDQIDNTLTNLKIIAMIPKNGRLCVRKGFLNLETEDHFQTIRRFLNNDSRDICLDHIKNTILNAIKITKNIMNNQIEVELKNWTLQQISIEIRNCQTGLTNLKTTYNDDAVMKSQIDVLLERLNVHCEELSEYQQSKKI
jgi:hypothetical protein